MTADLLAPCGINCFACEKYENPCPGCLMGDDGKSKATLKCKIKACYDKKNFKYCGRCSQFPCPSIKKHSKKYIKRYGYDTLESAKRIKTMGIGKIIEQDKEKWTCPECGGKIHFQSKKCSNCDYTIE